MLLAQMQAPVLTAADLSWSAVAISLIALASTLLIAGSKRRDKALDAAIAKQERKDKAEVDSKLTELYHKLERCDEQHKECEEERKSDRAEHDVAAKERAAATAENMRRIEELETLVGLRRKPKPPKSDVIRKVDQNHQPPLQ